MWYRKAQVAPAENTQEPAPQSAADQAIVISYQSGINNILNQKSWIANTIDEYINLAAEYSKDPKKLDTNRSYLRSNSRNSEIFNSKNFANDFSKILRRVWIEFVNKNIK